MSDKFEQSHFEDFIPDVDDSSAIYDEDPLIPGPSKIDYSYLDELAKSEKFRSRSQSVLIAIRRRAATRSLIREASIRGFEEGLAAAETVAAFSKGAEYAIRNAMNEDEDIHGNTAAPKNTWGLQEIGEHLSVTDEPKGVIYPLPHADGINFEGPLEDAEPTMSRPQVKYKAGEI